MLILCIKKPFFSSLYSHDQDYGDDVIMSSSTNPLDKTAVMSKANKDPRENDEVKLRPPPPLLAKGSPVVKVMLKASNSTTNR